MAEFDQNYLETCAQSALDQAAALGAAEAEISISQGSGFSVTARMQEVETLEHHRDQGLSVTVYFDQRKGNASTTDLSSDAIKETVEKACSMARFAAADDCAGLADKELLATSVPDLDLYHPWQIEVPDAIDLALACEAAALDVDSRIGNSEGATISVAEGVQVYANSLGFCGGYPDTHHSISCSVLAKDSGEMQRDYEYSVSRHPDGLTAADVIGREAGERALARLGSQKLKTATVPVLFPARLARGLIGHFVGAVSGGALYRKASFLLDTINTPVMASHISIQEDPHLLRGLGSAPFDGEGVATKPRSLVDAGVLQGYVLGSYSARKLGMQSTGDAGGVHNLLVSHSDKDFSALLAEMDTGLLVTELMGQGVNTVTGDYSRGAAGFWVEKGQIQYPVHEITIAGNLGDMLMNVVAVGNDIDRRSTIQCGSMLLQSMTVAGS